MNCASWVYAVYVGVPVAVYVVPELDVVVNLIGWPA
jgi:hypothetical protein